MRLFETVEGLDEVYLIMEYAAGGSLDAIIRIRGSLSEPEAQGVFVQVADGLQCVRGDGAVSRRSAPTMLRRYMHQRGVVHRDIKPENIFTTDLVRAPQPRAQQQPLTLANRGRQR